MVEKKQTQVGSDFDTYAKKWASVGYELEVKNAASLLGREKSAEVRRPGDEWGLQTDLRKVYVHLYQSYAKLGSSVLEIGSGAGRLTEVMAEDYGDRLAEYHTLDVSAEMTRVLRERVSGSKTKFVHHIGGSEVLGTLPENRFDLAYSQSCWSHINLYDQYLYLRDLRRAMTRGGVFFVNGIFMIGGNLDWAFDRFRRRVHQRENEMAGVYHEFTGQSVIIELALRLGWQILVVTPQAFILQFNHAESDILYDRWADVPTDRKIVPHAASPLNFFSGATSQKNVSFA